MYVYMCASIYQSIYSGKNADLGASCDFIQRFLSNNVSKCEGKSPKMPYMYKYIACAPKRLSVRMRLLLNGLPIHTLSLIRACNGHSPLLTLLSFSLYIKALYRTMGTALWAKYCTADGRRYVRRESKEAALVSSSSHLSYPSICMYMYT